MEELRFSVRDRSLPPATKLGQGYVFTRVCDFVHRGESVSVHAGIPPPPDQAPPRSRPLPPPPEQCMLEDAVNERAVRILLECNLVVKAP